MNQITYTNSEVVNTLLQKFYLLNNLTADSSYSTYEVVAKKYIESTSKEDVDLLKTTNVSVENIICSDNEKYDIILGLDNLKSSIHHILDGTRPLFLNFEGFKRLTCPPPEVFEYQGFSGKVRMPKGY